MGSFNTLAFKTYNIAEQLRTIYGLESSNTASLSATWYYILIPYEGTNVISKQITVNRKGKLICYGSITLLSTSSAYDYRLWLYLDSTQLAYTWRVGTGGVLKLELSYFGDINPGTYYIKLFARHTNDIALYYCTDATLFVEIVEVS
ncbi:MAG: hypothetical protein QXS19_09650 [Candidatus Methanomethylicia archaeon]